MLYIRTDMNDIIATGHVMRCLAIADAARNMGITTTFILADEQGKQYVENRGYQTIVLHTKWNDMESEISVLSEVIEKEKIDSLLIDRYQVTEEYLREVSKLVKTVYIDDLNQIDCAVDTIICYMSCWEKRQYNKKYPDKNLLLGLQYAPLREVFQNMPKKEISKRVNRLLMMSGGTDQYRVLERLVELLKDKDYEEIIVICGRYFEDVDKFIERYKGCKNIYIYKSVNNIEKYMEQADLVVSAGGTTLYELCACGTPAISYVIADNQLENAKSFDEEHLIDCAGDARHEEVFDRLTSLIKKYTDDVELCKERSERMQKMVDGKGAIRIVEAWKKL